MKKLADRRLFLASISECSQAPSTLIRFQTKTELFCSRYGCDYNAENDHRKRSDLKTMLFENVVSSVDED